VDLVNLLNERPYTVKVEEEAKRFTTGSLVYGSVVPWDGVWYWSGVQQLFGSIPDDKIPRLCKEFSLKAPHIVYRYNEPLAAKAREFIGKHSQQFLTYYGKELVQYPDSRSMAVDARKFMRYQMEEALKDLPVAERQKYNRPDLPPTPELPSELLDMKNGIGVYFNPAEGQEMMAGFNAIVSGLQKHGVQLTDDEAESLRAFLYSEAISPQFVRLVAREYGDASIAAAFFIQPETAPEYVEYLLRKYKGHFYRRRYPSLTLVDQ
jgi:hypothetical protein